MQAPHTHAESNINTTALLEGLPVAMLVVNADGAIRYRNEAARRSLPWATMVEKALSCFRLPEVFRGWRTELEACRESGQPVRFLAVRCEGLGSADEPRAVTHSAYLVEIFRSNGESREVAICVYEALAASAPEDRDEIARRLTSLGKMAARVAHELNNPLDGILRYINLALRLAAQAPESKIQSYLTESRTGLLRMVEIIGDLLEYSRATAGAFDEIGINELVEQAVRSQSDRAAAAGIVMAVDFQTAGLPSASGGRLYQVCCNLIRNAIDAMPEGGRLSVITALVDEHVVIRVSDTGVGLPEPPEKIFEPFYTTKLPGKGTGLGLAICKDFIEDMGGTITAERGQPKGAAFTVRIPSSRCGAARKPGRSRRGSVVR